MGNEAIKNFYAEKGSEKKALLKARLSGSGLRVPTAISGGSYPIEFKKDGTKTVIRVLISRSKKLSGLFTSGKAIDAIDLLSEFTEVKSGEKAIEFTKTVSAIIGRSYGNLNRLYSEFKSKIGSGLIRSFAIAVPEEKRAEYISLK